MRKTMKLVLLAGLALNLQGVAFSDVRPPLEEGELTNLFDRISRKQPPFDTRAYTGVPMSVAQDEIKPGIVWVKWIGNGSNIPDGVMRHTPTELQITAEQQRPLPLSARVLGRLLGVKPLHSLVFTLKRDGSISYTAGEVTGLGPLVRQGWSEVTFPTVPILGRVAYVNLGRIMAKSVLRGLLVVLRK